VLYHGEAVQNFQPYALGVQGIGPTSGLSAKLQSQTSGLARRRGPTPCA
jgi:hypothetical protein